MDRFLVILLVLQICYFVTSVEWPIKRVSLVEGDIILGGFFPIHGKDNDIMCGRLQDEGLVELEAMLFTVDQINQDNSILPGIRLGVLAVDSCDSIPKALEEAVEFAKGFIVKEDITRELDKRKFRCAANRPPVYKDGLYEKVAAVIGGHSSWVSMQVADLMRIYKIPQVSYQSTNPALSDKTNYEYFFRTVPPLDHQVHAILKILKNFGWSYVSIVYADSDYGNRGYDVLKKLGPSQSICFSSQQRINVEDSKEEHYDFVMSNLLTKNATAVIVFGDHEMARNLISAATRADAFKRFVWIGSTAWVSRSYVTSGNERTVEGAIGITHDITPLKNFDQYLKIRDLTEHSKINPWFSEYWEEKLKCKVKDFDETPFNRNYTQSCSTTGLQLPSSCYTQSTPAAQFVRDAVYAVAHALHAMLCRKRRRLCTPSSLIDGPKLKTYLNHVSFDDEKGNEFRFDAKGDGPPRYKVVNFQKNEDGQYEWVAVGDYHLENNVSRLEFHKEKIRYKIESPVFPESLCSKRCKVGQAKTILDDENCCWHCSNCSEFQIVHNEIECMDCPLGTLPAFDRTQCESIAIVYMDYSSPWAIGCIVFSVFGILLTVFIAVVFGKFWETPVFKVSGRELSVIVLIGAFLSFNLTFAIVSRPSAFSCGVVRFFLGFCYTISYAAIATKTRLISRLADQQRVPDKKPKPLNIRNLLTITMALISVESTINSTWLLHSPPETDYHYPTRLENVLICKGSDTAGYLVGLVYPFLLVAFCTCYAFQIREFRGAFYESRYINFTNYTTFVVWLAFLPMFLLNKNMVLRVVVLSLLLNVSALVQMVCLFLPKVYLALRRPEKNRLNNEVCIEYRQSVPART